MNTQDIKIDVENAGFLTDVWRKVVSEQHLIKITVDLIIFFIRINLAILFFLLTKRIIKKVLEKYYNSKHFKSIDKSVRTFLSSIIDTGILIILIVICLLIVGVKEGSLVAFLGTIGLGIGLALKDNLSNFVGGVIILIFKTHSVGDEVKIGDNVGVIHSIDVFSTNILCFDNTIVTIPNGSIVTSAVINYSKTPIRRVKIIASVDYNCDLELAKKVLLEFARNTPNALSYPEPKISVESYGDSSINLGIKVWGKNEDYWGMYHYLLDNLKKTLDGVDISIPFPQLDVHVNNVQEIREKENRE